MTTVPVSPRRVLIIDGHPAVGRGLSALVREMPGVQVVGLATRSERGLAQAAEATPDVALVDADLPGLWSEAVIRLLRFGAPQARIVAVGIYPERRWTLLQAGAHQFVLKDAGYEALRDAIGRRAGDVHVNSGDAISGEAGGSVPAEQIIPDDGAVVTAPTASVWPTLDQHPRPSGAHGREKRAFA